MARLNGMPRDRVPRRVAITFRLDADLAVRVKAFCRDHAGRPLYINQSGFFAAAVEAHLARLQAMLERDDTPQANHLPH